jgi:hypothetical protein
MKIVVVCLCFQRCAFVRRKNGGNDNVFNQRGGERTSPPSHRVITTSQVATGVHCACLPEGAHSCVQEETRQAFHQRSPVNFSKQICQFFSFFRDFLNSNKNAPSTQPNSTQT